MRGGDRAGHRQVQAKALEAEQIGEGCGQRPANRDNPPDHHGYVAGSGSQARFPRLVELVEDAQEFGLDDCFAARMGLEADELPV
jgi:hypothetical protein